MFAPKAVLRNATHFGNYDDAAHPTHPQNRLARYTPPGIRLFPAPIRHPRTLARSADQHNGSIQTSGFFYVSNEIGVDVPFWSIDPRNQNRTYGMTDKHVFYLATHVG